MAPPQRRLIAGNWKMNQGGGGAADLARRVRDGLPQSPAADVLVLPPFTALAAVHRVLGEEGRVRLGAQNCYWEKDGAFTGEVSAWMVAELCDYVLVGHSERRQLFFEDDLIVRRKLDAGLEAGLLVILALGETQEEREQNLTEAVLTRQARAGLLGLSPSQLARCTIAYEPIWAIGTGQAATPADASRAAAILQGVVREAAGGPLDQVRILYGGSVTPDSARELLRAPGVGGALVGGASLRADEFCQIVAAAGG